MRKQTVVHFWVNKTGELHTSPTAMVMTCGVKPMPAEPATQSPVAIQFQNLISQFVGIKKMKYQMNSVRIKPTCNWKTQRQEKYSNGDFQVST